MLGKLLKYEWKNTYKVGCILLICMAAVTLLGCISLRMPFLYDNISGELYVGFGVLDMMGFMTLFLYIMTLAGITYAIMIYLGVHFYKSMYTDEGYLTHTLPATAHQILISKILVSTLWMLIITVSIVASLIVLLYTAVCLYMAATPAEVTAEFVRFVSELFEEMSTPSAGSLAHLSVSLIAITVLTPIASVTTLFGSITLGQLFKKHRGIMAIVCYIGVSIVSGLVRSMITMPVSMGLAFKTGIDSLDNYMMDFYSGIFDLTTITTLVVGVVLYIVSYLILTKKFDIE